MEEKFIYKANSLIEASYRLSLYEQRIILACIAQVRRDALLTDQHLYIVSAQQIADMSGVCVKRSYQHIKAAAERLFDRRITLHDAPNGAGKAKVRLTRWVQEVVYQESQGTVALRFSQPMVPYLSQLTEQFTRYALLDVSRMSSSHAIRLYELFSQWQKVGRREVELDWLRQILQLEGRYENIRDLKRRVIEPAVKQINEHSPLWVKWSQRKTGRRVTHLIFNFGEKPRAKAKAKTRRASSPKPKASALPEGPSMFGIPPEEIQKHALAGDSWSIAAARARVVLSKK